MLQKTEEKVNFLLTRRVNHGGGEHIFKFFNLKRGLKNEINRKTAIENRKLFVTLHPIYQAK